MRNWLPAAAMVAGLMIGLVGGYFAYYLPIDTKLYNLSNEIIGAGIFFVGVGILGKIIAKK